MKQRTTLFYTGNHNAGIALRAALGAVLFPHGAQLLFGWFGGFGFQGSMQYFQQVEGLPWLVGFGVIMLQFFGALAILAGAATRLFALAFTFLFIGMIITSHLDYGFFMNWSGKQAGEGFEYHILAIGLSIALLLSGAGRFSVDRFLTAKAEA
jgi:putative oxidoreductase